MNLKLKIIKNYLKSILFSFTSAKIWDVFNYFPGKRINIKGSTSEAKFKLEISGKSFVTSLLSSAKRKSELASYEWHLSLTHFPNHGSDDVILRCQFWQFEKLKPLTSFLLAVIKIWNMRYLNNRRRQKCYNAHWITESYS